MSGLTPQNAEGLIKLLGLLGSTFAGERAVAGAKADKLIRDLGLRWADVILSPSPKPSPRSSAPWMDDHGKIRFCSRHADLLTPWETSFLDSVSHRRWPLTPKQTGTLDRIVNKIWAAGRRP